MERGKFQLPDRNNSSLKTKIAQCDYDKYSRHWTQNCQPLKALSQFSWLAQLFLQVGKLVNLEVKYSSLSIN